MLIHHRVIPSNKFFDTHSNTWQHTNADWSLSLSDTNHKFYNDPRNDPANNPYRFVVSFRTVLDEILGKCWTSNRVMILVD